MNNSFPGLRRLGAGPLGLQWEMDSSVPPWGGGLPVCVSHWAIGILPGSGPQAGPPGLADMLWGVLIRPGDPLKVTRGPDRQKLLTWYHVLNPSLSPSKVPSPRTFT
jgi:hypothetical protein